MAFRRHGKAPTPSEVLFDDAKIDLVVVTADQSAVELVIVADAPWTGSDAQIRSLQNKIHHYVGFAMDGQLAATDPELSILPWRIVIRCLNGEPDPRTADVLSRTVEPVRGYGGDLQVHT